ncbi:MAG: ParA family protein [Cyanobacteria bacterium J06606_4]
MGPPIIAFFNNRGGVGKTSLVYHLAWMYNTLGIRVVAADLNPQANLTAAFLSEERLEEVWELDNLSDGRAGKTVFSCIHPLRKGMADIEEPELEHIDDDLNLLTGDLRMSLFEENLASEWLGCLRQKERPLSITSAFGRMLEKSGKKCNADIVLVDLGPNFSAINRAALVFAEYVVVPLSPDIFSLQALKDLGPTLSRWREEWKECLTKNIATDLKLPSNTMQPIGYIILQPSIRFDRPVQAFQRWILEISSTYRAKVIQSKMQVSTKDDVNCLALLKHYQSLMPMAQEARKPIFHLKPADGAIGAHSNAVQSVYQDFKKLAMVIAERVDLTIPQ